jgi:hypothetical protein
MMKAHFYSLNKLDKYAICFYPVVGNKYYYLSSIFDNRAGNTTGISEVQDYCCLFSTIRTPFYRVLHYSADLADTHSAFYDGAQYI